MTRRRQVAIAAATALLLAAGAAFAMTRGQAPATHARAGTVAIVLDDFRFRPQKVLAQPGQLRFELRNVGRLPHAFRLLRSGNEVLKVPSLSPGEAVTVVRRVTPGTYRFLCPLQNHAELGMYGSVVVSG